MSTLSAADVPSLPRGVRLRFDTVRNKHMLLAPERAFGLDAVAASVVELVDGQRSVGAICDLLAERYGEKREVIEGDVIAMLDDLLTKRVIER
ncbi:pyrroloquinoline quinone biosynthesis peptide chaperone PqqD [Labrys okinawensis]|uniref:Pyrroloquinoline quinone biosynthesis peptide chaperone PqqD n=1 Tax=Labrys okinawensis TaxID=346911 RepID=A0A2S9Q8U8_9HYPH|nr:pyrroloquinoline quinone biosynthesis peptide chaperone PqqD [Labrys okinawensis]